MANVLTQGTAIASDGFVILDDAEVPTALYYVRNDVPKGLAAFPGGIRLLTDNDSASCLEREMAEKVPGLKIDSMTFWGVLDSPTRDERASLAGGRVVSHTYIVHAYGTPAAGPKAQGIVTYPISDLERQIEYPSFRRKFAFDHGAATRDILKLLGAEQTAKYTQGQVGDSPMPQIWCVTYITAGYSDPDPWGGGSSYGKDRIDRFVVANSLASAKRLANDEIAMELGRYPDFKGEDLYHPNAKASIQIRPFPVEMLEVMVPEHALPHVGPGIRTATYFEPPFTKDALQQYEFTVVLKERRRE